MNQRRLEIVLADQRLGDLDRGRGGHRLAVGGEDADRMRAVGQVDRLHIGDLLGAEAQERFVSEGVKRVVCSFSMATSLAASARTCAARGDVDGVVRSGVILAGIDTNGPDARLRHRPHQVDRQQAVVETGGRHFDPVGQHEGPLELARGDAAMEKDAVGIVGLLAADRELVLDQFDHQIVGREAGHGQHDAQAVLADPLDIVRRVALGALGQAIKGALELVETQQQGRIEHRHTAHKTLLRGASGREPVKAFPWNESGEHPGRFKGGFRSPGPS